MGKIKAKGVVSYKPGPTVTCNDPLKLQNASGRGSASNGVVREAVGPTINVNSPAVTQPNANKPPPPTKILTSKTGTQKISELATAKSFVASGGNGQPYNLKDRYPK